jgi:hypothetical protein
VSAKVICRFIDLSALARTCDDHIGNRHQRFDGGVEGEPHHIISAGVDNQPVELDVAVTEVLIGYGLVPLDSEFGVELIRDLGVLPLDGHAQAEALQPYAICFVAMTLENAAQSSDLFEPALARIFDAHRQLIGLRASQKLNAGQVESNSSMLVRVEDI